MLDQSLKRAMTHVAPLQDQPEPSVLKGGTRWHAVYPTVTIAGKGYPSGQCRLGAFERPRYGSISEEPMFRSTVVRQRKLAAAICSSSMEQFMQPGGGMVGDTGQHVGEPGARAKTRVDRPAGGPLHGVNPPPSDVLGSAFCLCSLGGRTSVIRSRPSRAGEYTAVRSDRLG